MTAVETSRAGVVVALDAGADPARIGGKAHALGRLGRVDVRVPRGFAIVTDVLEQHLARRELVPKIDALLADLDAGDPERLTRASASIRSLVRETSIGPDAWASIVAAARPLLARGRVVVRSSAIGEDGVGESFAGQLDSILHVDGEQALERAIIDCWSSLWSERVLFYRAARGMPARGMGVIVQQQVDAAAAGVLFTATEDGDMLAEFTSGLANELVSGAIDPGRATIDRATGSFEVLAACEHFAFTAALARDLRSAGIELERALGAAQDVEWALDRTGTLYIVQARPITAPVSIGRGARRSPTRRIAWSNANVNENFPGPISPLLYSIAARGYTNYFRNLAVAFGVSSRRIAAMEPAFRQIIGVHGARMYYNLTSIHSVLRLAPFGRALTASFDTFVGADGSSVDAATRTHASRWKEYAETARIVFSATRRFTRIDRGIRRFEAVVDGFAERTRPDRLRRMSLVELRDALAEFMDIRCNRWLDASLADAASMICFGALQRLLGRAYRDGEGGAVHTSLLKAIPDVVSGVPVLELWKLSRLVRSDATLLACFDALETSEILERIRSEPAFARFQSAFQRYLDDWGFRCSEELMLTVPSFQENPGPVIDMIRAYARLDGPSPEEALRAQTAERESMTRRVMDELRGTVAWPLLSVLLPWTHAAIRYRERARLKQALLYSRCRRIALAIGDALARRETIVERDDVFFLTVDELTELLGGAAMFPDGVRAIVSARRAEHARLSALSLPDAFTLAEGEYLDAIGASANVDAATAHGPLRGTSACGGAARGRAIVLRDVGEAGRIEKGDILITRQTDPGWAPVFFLISGLVIERGGMLSHGAIVAREFGIPCVVGVQDATRRIESGCVITVDGDRGEVHVVD